MIDLEKLTPFQFFALTNFPYIEADFDALTNYQLFCEITKYLNGISSSQNDVISNFNELLQNWNDFSEAITSEWNDTKDYIDNYFENLDVQEEINNKLDQMASDGTLLEVIQSTVVGEARTITENWLAQLTPSTEVIIDTTLTVAGACADAKATGDAISDVKGAFEEFAEQSLLPFTLSQWESHGSIDSNGDDVYLWPAARTTTITSYAKDVIFHCDSGYRFFVAFYNPNDTFDHLSTLGTDDVFIEANTKFRLVMRLIPDGSGDASILSKHIHIRDDSFLVNEDLKDTNAVLEKISETTQNLFTGENSWLSIGFVCSDGKITNTTTDTKNNLSLLVRILDSSNNVIGTSATKNIYADEEVSLTVSATTAGAKLEILHSGANLDIKCYYDFATEANQAYTFSCYVSGHNPTVAGGIVLEKIQIEKGINATPYIPPLTATDFIARAPLKFRNFTDTNYVLWLGTSIPEGAQYPYRACEANGYSCINKAVGSSKLCFDNTYIAGSSEYKGRRLTATVSELEALYRADVTNNVITEATLNSWKAGSYENSVLPYINGTADTQVSIIVIDHGFNDSGTIIEQLEDVDNINWASADRSTFTGAFRYLLNQIQAINPFIKIVIAGYFQNTIQRLGNVGYYGDSICEMQELIGKHYDISVMKAWEHTQINGEFVSGTSNYITDFNSEYGTSYTPMLTDAQGNIPAIQIYCPDTIHPHSDKTGNTNKRLNAVYTKLLAHMI